ncbi:MAG: response regulator [Desulfobacteraceae bacterium]|jgi:CheY-like chemotaxis protein
MMTDTDKKTMDYKPTYEELEKRVEELEKDHADADGYEKRMERNKIIGGIAHEFNNLLMGIQGNLSLIFLDIPFTDRFYSKLKDIEKYVEGGVKLTEKILDFVNDGTYEPEPKLREIQPDVLNRLKYEMNKSIEGHLIKSNYGSQGSQALKLYEKVYTGSNTVLLVDDEGMILDVGKQMLERTGLEVLTAKNGEKAVELYKKEHKKINMVVLDLIMPGMTGIDTYYELKKINPDIKVLFASGYRKNLDVNVIIEEGRSSFIQKPFKMEQLTQEIGKLLEL